MVFSLPVSRHQLLLVLNSSPKMCSPLLFSSFVIQLTTDLLPEVYLNCLSHKALLQFSFARLSNYTMPVTLLSLNRCFSKCESWTTYIRITQGQLLKMWFLILHLNLSAPKSRWWGMGKGKAEIGILATPPIQSHCSN